jgi:hypothetical protein
MKKQTKYDYDLLFKKSPSIGQFALNGIWEQPW